MATAASAGQPDEQLLGPPAGSGTPIKYQHSSSKYDFVKVRVWLSDCHYYVLSRFLVSRVLTASQVNYTDALRIALGLKKALVDSERLDTTQAAMEEVLFSILSTYGYGDRTRQLYRMVSRFHHLRCPLVVLIGGAESVGKSTLATQLAERLNLSSVLQTMVVYQLMHSISRKTRAASGRDQTTLPISSSSNANALEDYEQQCELVEKGLSAEFTKCIREGKSMIVEGIHVQPDLVQRSLKRIGALAAGESEPNLPSKLDWIAPGVVVSFLLVMQSEERHWQAFRSGPPVTVVSSSEMDDVESGGHPSGTSDSTTSASGVSSMANRQEDGAMQGPSHLDASFRRARRLQDQLVCRAADHAALLDSHGLFSGVRFTETVVLSVDQLGFDQALERMHTIVLDRMQLLLQQLDANGLAPPPSARDESLSAFAQ